MAVFAYNPALSHEHNQELANEFAQSVASAVENAPKKSVFMFGAACTLEAPGHTVNPYTLQSLFYKGFGERKQNVPDPHKRRVIWHPNYEASQAGAGEAGRFIFSADTGRKPSALLTSDVLLDWALSDALRQAVSSEGRDILLPPQRVAEKLSFSVRSL